MMNFELAKLFYDLADILEAQGVQWKPAAYRKAARTIESLQEPIEALYAENGIEAIQEMSGIGESIAKKIAEFIKTGKISAYEKEKKKLLRCVHTVI